MRVWHLLRELASRFLAYSLVVMQPMGLFPDRSPWSRHAGSQIHRVVIVDHLTASKGNCPEPVVLGNGVCMYCKKNQPTAGGYERTTI
jgi:hypothetical protein